MIDMNAVTLVRKDKKTNKCPKPTLHTFEATLRRQTEKFAEFLAFCCEQQ